MHVLYKTNLNFFFTFLWFSLQTYGLQLKNSTTVEMYTFVHKVQTDSAAESAGLTTGGAATSSIYTVLHTTPSRFLVYTQSETQLWSQIYILQCCVLPPTNMNLC